MMPHPASPQGYSSWLSRPQGVPRFGSRYDAQTYPPVGSLVGIWLSMVDMLQFAPLHFTAALSKSVGCIVEMGASVTLS